MRHSIRLAAAVLAALPLCAAGASAQDTTVVTTKSPVRWAKVLDGQMLVASDRPGNKPNRIQRVVDGRVSAAAGLAGSGILVDVEQPGRTRTGRVVFPIRRAARITSDDRLVGMRWFLYDAKRDRAERLRGLPGGACTPANVAVWRELTAYLVECKARAGVYLRDAGGTKRVSKLTAGDYDDPLLLRANTLAMVTGDLDGGRRLYRLVANGERCEQLIEPSTSDADHDFTVHDAWIDGRRLNWWMETSTTGGNLVLSTLLRRDCSAPKAAGAYPPSAEMPLALNGPYRYTTDGRTVNRHDIGTSSTFPPANDAVTEAQDLGGTVPITVGARIGFATRTADEPAVTGRAAAGGTATATRTVWYAYRPAAATTVTVTGEVQDLRGGALLLGALSVYDDPGTGTLTELPKAAEENQTRVTFAADPAHRYLIGLGCDSPMACWPTFTLRVTAG